MSSNTGVAGGPSDGPPPPSPPSPNPKAPANPPPLETSSSSSDNEPPPAKNPHASQNRWRHQESAAFARHAAREAARAGPPKPPGHHHAIPRDAAVGDKGGVGDLANFLNKTRVAPPSAGGGIGASGSGSAAAAGRYKPITIAAGESDDVGGTGADPSVSGPSAPHDERSLPEMRLDGRREVVCGPLLNYRRMELSSPEAEGEAPKGKWFGSVLIVTKGGGRNTPNVAPPPVLRLRRLGEVEGDNYDSVEPSFEAEMTGALLEQQQASRGGGSSEATAGPAAGNGVAAGAGSGDGKLIEGVCLYSDPRNTFWAFALELDMSPRETKWEYTIASVKYKSRTQSARSCFFVPATTESMRIMFFSCNGFSVGTDEDAWCGPALWNDVLRRHAERPFHVMIGGGDQIYNDAIRVDGPLRPWADIGNPVKRREYPFPEKLRQECDDYYLKNYLRWYATEPFAEANGQIAQLNIWDDHDIIDGFGSYVDQFMRCDVFRGIGGTAHKYYMLFQHHLPPPPSTYTSDAKNVTPEDDKTQAVGPNQLVDTYCAPRLTLPNYIVGSKPGPYVAEHSHNMFCRLGSRIAFLGIDARTERTRHQVNYPETYDAVFERLTEELTMASESGLPIKHLIMLLGIPIAYPRLTWLENVLSSPIIAPIKFLHRRFGVGGDFFNYFDGNVDLLDDLDDHYTARTHKKERNALVERLQGICRDHSVRITILSGDVHLCAVGRFYSKLSLGLAAENDYRYMPNVISSAITNKPPPQAVANLLARRNKIHHLDRNTEETLLKVFDKDPGNTCKTAKHNKVTMPSRNFAMITENSPNNPAPAAATTTNGTDAGHRANGRTAPRTDGTPAAAENGRPASSSSSSSSSSSNSDHGDDGKQDKFPGKDGHYPLHRGEAGAGTSHKAAQTPGSHGRGRDGSLDVCLRVEIDQHDPLGRTQGYGLTVPALTVTAEKARDAHIHGLRAADKLKDKAKSKAEDKTGRAAPQSAVGGVGAEMAQMHEMQEVRS